MNCPKCKNPINDNASECDWCGAKILGEVIIKEKSKIEIFESNKKLIVLMFIVLTFLIIAVFSNPKNNRNDTSDNDYQSQQPQEESSEGDKPIDDAINKKNWVNDE